MRVIEYHCAAENIERDGKPVTVAALSESTGVDECTIRQFLNRHPGVADSIGIESYEQHMRALYLTAAILIKVLRPHDNSGARTSELCRMLSFQASRVRYFLRKHGDLAQNIGWIDDRVSRD
jgi:hypothetical protein